MACPSSAGSTPCAFLWLPVPRALRLRPTARWRPGGFAAPVIATRKPTAVLRSSRSGTHLPPAASILPTLAEMAESDLAPFDANTPAPTPPKQRRVAQKAKQKHDKALNYSNSSVRREANPHPPPRLPGCSSSSSRPNTKWEAAPCPNDGQTTRSSTHQHNQVSDWTSLLLSSLSFWSSRGDTL